MGSAARRRRRYHVPGLGAFLVGSTVLYSESRRQQARESVDLYFNPNLAGVGLLDWKSFDRIVEIGYRHARDTLSALSERDLAPYRNDGAIAANRLR